MMLKNYRKSQEGENNCDQCVHISTKNQCTKYWSHWPVVSCGCICDEFMCDACGGTGRVVALGSHGNVAVTVRCEVCK